MRLWAAPLDRRGVGGMSRVILNGLWTRLGRPSWLNRGDRVLVFMGRVLGTVPCRLLLRGWSGLAGSLQGMGMGNESDQVT